MKVTKDNEDDSTNTSQETQVIVSATACRYVHEHIDTHTLLGLSIRRAY